MSEEMELSELGGLGIKQAAAIPQFYQARGPVLVFMRKDLGYKRFLQIEHNDFVHSFLSDYGKKR
jgi:hypothetical protein